MARQSGAIALSAERGGKSVLSRIKDLYEADTPAAHRFRYGLLAFDIAATLYVVTTSFFTRTQTIEIIDMVLGTVILADFIARLAIETERRRHFLRLATWADIIAIISFLAPIAGEGLGFLRILRTLRLLHSYQLLKRLRTDLAYFRRHEEVLLAALNLMVFLFVTTGLIYALQHGRNDDIRNYADAFYFTVTTLTTTGFGDITLEGTSGRLLSVGVMIVGVTLFLRLAQVLFRPSKVRQECQSCGLMLHDADAVHCKHCGEIIRIKTEGSA